MAARAPIDVDGPGPACSRKLSCEFPTKVSINLRGACRLPSYAPPPHAMTAVGCCNICRSHWTPARLSNNTANVPAIVPAQTPRIISKLAKHVLAICTLPTARRRQPPKLISDTYVYTVIFSGTPADIFYPPARRCSTSDLFPTWAMHAPRGIS